MATARTASDKTAAETQPAPRTRWAVVARWVAWAIWLACMALALAGFVGLGVEGAARATASNGPLAFLSGALLAASWATVSLILTTRRPENPIGWLFGAMGLVAGFSNLAWAMMIRTLGSSPPDVEAGRVWGWLISLIGPPVWGVAISLVFLLFPTGRPLSPAWGRVRWVMIIGAVIGTIGFALSPGALVFLPQYRNPFRLTGTAGELMVAARAIGEGVVLVCGLGAAASMYLRYRSAQSIERHQLKWIAFAAAVFAVVGSSYVILGGLLSMPDSPVGGLFWALFAASASLVPIAAAVAILRYRLYDIDEIIGRTFVYGALTAILAGVYTASVRLFNSLFVAATGEESDAALVLTTLILATSFTPIKKRLEDVVERRFHQEEGKDEQGAEPPEAPVTRAELEEIVRRVVREERIGQADRKPAKRVATRSKSGG